MASVEKVKKGRRNLMQLEPTVTHTDFLTCEYIAYEIGVVAMTIWYYAHSVVTLTDRECGGHSWPPRERHFAETAEGKWWVTTVEKIVCLFRRRYVLPHQVAYAIKKLRAAGLLAVRRASHQNRVQSWYRALPLDPKLLADWIAKRPSNERR